MGRRCYQHPDPDHPPNRVMPKSKPLPPAEVLEEWFLLDPSTGRLYWRKKPAKQVPSGREAGWKQMHGPLHPRWSIHVPGHSRFLRSRLVWKMTTGNDPKGIIDHRNGNSLDDRFENLLDTDHSWNNRNRKVRSKSGLRGAYPSPNGDGKWCCTMQINNEKIYVGTFDTAEEAAAAYDVIFRALEQEAIERSASR